MRKLRSFASPIAAFAMVASLSGSAKAACCDDAWSCLGAVLTAGASCAVEEAIAKIDEFVKRVQRTRSEGETNMNASLKKLDDETSRDHASAFQGTASGLDSVQQARGRAEAANQRQRDKSNQETEQLLAEALRRIEALEAEAARHKNEGQARLQQANAERQRLLSGMSTAFQVSFLAPLAGLVAPLIAVVEPVSAAATIAAAAATLDRIQRDTDRLMSQRFAEFEARARADHDALSRQQAEQKSRADEAAALASAVEAITSTPTASEDGKSKLKLLLKPGAKAGANLKLMKLVPLKLVTQPKAQTLPLLAKNLKADAKFASSVKINKTFDKAKANRAIQSELDKRFAEKKTEQELRTEEQKLITEAKARFGKDEKTLKAAEEFIHAETTKRVNALAERAKPKDPKDPKAPGQIARPTPPALGKR